jgi:hypothetical protein
MVEVSIVDLAVARAIAVLDRIFVDVPFTRASFPFPPVLPGTSPVYIPPPAGIFRALWQN